MLFINWDDKYNLGNVEIDGHHQFIVDLINELYSIRTHHMHSASEKLIKDLEEYSLIHFEAEEKLLSQLHYPDLVAHMALHDVFKKRVRQIKQDYRPPKNNIIEDDIFQFLREWWLNHIINEDIKYKTSLPS